MSDANEDYVNERVGWLRTIIFFFQIIIMAIALAFQILWFFAVLIGLCFKKRLKVFAPILWGWGLFNKANAYDDELVEENQPHIS